MLLTKTIADLLGKESVSCDGREKTCRRQEMCDLFAECVALLNSEIGLNQRKKKKN